MRKLWFCCLTFAGCGGSVQAPSDLDTRDAVIVTLDANSSGNLVSCRGNVCEEVPNPAECHQLIITIDPASGSSCQRCTNVAAETIFESCGEQGSVTCELVTIATPDCMVCAIADGPVIYSTCNPEAQAPPITPPAAGARDGFARIEAESYDAQSGSRQEGGHVGYLDDGDYLGFFGLDFGQGSGAASIAFDVAVPPAMAGKTIEVRIDALNGPRVAALTVANTGTWTTFARQAANLVPVVKGVHDVYLVMVGGADVANIDAFMFQSSAVALPPAPPAGGGLAYDIAIADMRLPPDASVKGENNAGSGGVFSASALRAVVERGVTIRRWNGFSAPASQFYASINNLVPWMWVFEADGNSTSNTAVEVRNIRAYFLVDGSWQRIAIAQGVPEACRESYNGYNSLEFGNCGDRGQAIGGDTIRVEPEQRSAAYEIWPADAWSPKFNPDVFQRSNAVWVMCEARKVMKSSSGPDDRASARFVAQLG